MDNLYYNLPEDRGFGGFIKSVFSKPNNVYNLSSINSPEEYLDIVRAAKLEVENAERLFNSTSDPDLVEYAIYHQYAAKLKLSYLIKKAKEYNIKAAGITIL